jgi:hypothetical protein
MLTNIRFRNTNAEPDAEQMIEDAVVHECLRDPQLVKQINLTKFSFENIYKLYAVSRIGKPYAKVQHTSTTQYSGYGYKSVFERYVDHLNQRQSWFSLDDNQVFRECMTFGYQQEQSELICLCFAFQVLNLAKLVPFTIFDKDNSRIYSFLFKGTGNLYGEDKAIVAAIRKPGFITSPDQDQIELAFLHFTQTVETIKFLQGVC